MKDLFKKIHFHYAEKLPVKVVFRHSENVFFFLTNSSFQQVKSEFLFSGNSILLFISIQYSVISIPLLALKSVSTSQNEECSWNIFSTKRKKNITGRSIWKIERKKRFLLTRISCPLAIISFFFENCFPPNSNNAFHLQKNSSDQITLFPLDKKSVSTRRMKDLLKNTFPLYGKARSQKISYIS